jgi:hypothetical protein
MASYSQADASCRCLLLAPSLLLLAPFQLLLSWEFITALFLHPVDVD